MLRLIVHDSGGEVLLDCKIERGGSSFLATVGMGKGWRCAGDELRLFVEIGMERL